MRCASRESYVDDSDWIYEQEAQKARQEMTRVGRALLDARLAEIGARQAEELDRQQQKRITREQDDRARAALLRAIRGKASRTVK
jgi:hypothetical protein